MNADVPVPMDGYSPGLRLLGALHWDAMKQRIAMSNRIGSPDVEAKMKERLTDFVAGLEETEEAARKMLIGEFKAVAPHLVKWCDSVPGVGIPTIARLVGVIGAPAIAYPFVWETDADGKRAERPTALEPYWRSLGQLRSYCGYGDPNRRRRRGMTAEEALGLGNPDAKTLLFLVVQSCVKVNRGPIREAYDLARAKYAPLQEIPTDAGGITAGHAQNRAYRFAAKEVIKRLWVADREHYGLSGEASTPVAA